MYPLTTPPPPLPPPPSPTKQKTMLEFWGTQKHKVVKLLIYPNTRFSENWRELIIIWFPTFWAHQNLIIIHCLKQIVFILGSRLIFYRNPNWIPIESLCDNTCSCGQIKNTPSLGRVPLAYRCRSFKVHRGCAKVIQRDGEECPYVMFCSKNTLMLWFLLRGTRCRAGTWNLGEGMYQVPGARHQKHSVWNLVLRHAPGAKHKSPCSRCQVPCT